VNKYCCLLIFQRFSRDLSPVDFSLNFDFPKISDYTICIIDL